MVAGRGGRGTSRPSLWPLLPQDTRNSQVPGEPHPEQPALPSSPTPPPPGSGQTLPVALPRGSRRAHPSPALQGPQGLQPPAGPKTHHLPRWDSLTGPGLPRRRAGGCSSGALLSRGPSSPPHKATGPEEPALGLRHKLLQAHVPLGTSLRRTLQTVGHCAAASRPAPSALPAPRLALGVPSSSLPLARANPRPHSPLPMAAAGPDGVQLRKPRNPGPPEAKTWERRPAVTWTLTGSEGDAATVRVRRHAQNVKAHLRRRTPEVRLPQPAQRAGQAPGLYFPEVSAPSS